MRGMKWVCQNVSWGGRQRWWKREIQSRLLLQMYVTNDLMCHLNFISWITHINLNSLIGNWNADSINLFIGWMNKYIPYTESNESVAICGVTSLQASGSQHNCTYITGKLAAGRWRLVKICLVVIWLDARQGIPSKSKSKLLKIVLRPILTS